MRTVEFPDGLEKISQAAFEESGVEQIVLPASLRTIA